MKEAYDKAVPYADAPDLKALEKVHKAMEKREGNVKDGEPYGHYFWRLQADTAGKLRRFETVESAVRKGLQTPACADDQECFQDLLSQGMLAAHRRGDAEGARKIFELGHEVDAGRGRMPWRGPNQLAKTVVLDKESKPFFEVDEIPLAAALEKAFPAILKELDGIFPPGPSPARFVGTVDALAREAAATGDEYSRKRAADFLNNARDLCELEDAAGPRLSADQPCWEETILYAAGKSGSQKGIWNEDHCALVPQTCLALQTQELTGNLGLGHLGVAGKASFVVMHPNSRILAHSGDHNARLTVHLGLRVPEGTYIEVRGERRSWKSGQALVLDDSYIHYVSNPSSEDRVILLAHVWHPSVVRAHGGFKDGPSAEWARAAEVNKTLREPRGGSEL